MKKVSPKIHIVIDIFILLFVIMLTLSFFFPSIMILSKGIDANSTPHPLTLLEYINYNSPLLLISFVFALITIFICVGILVVTVLEMFRIIGRTHIKEVLGFLVIITSIIAFACTIAYCIQNTSYSTNTDDVYLKFAPGVSMYVVLVCGFFSGIGSIIDSPTLIDLNPGFVTLPAKIKVEGAGLEAGDDSSIVKPQNNSTNSDNSQQNPTQSDNPDTK